MGGEAINWTTIGHAFTGRDNRLTLIRLFLATAVMIEHIFVVPRGLAGGPVVAIHGWSIGYVAVSGFFILSGFLIAGSLEHRANLASYAASRALRILPALLVLAISSVLFIGPFVTTASIPDYWTGSQTWLYPVNVMLFLDTEQGPLGVFGNNPAPGEFSATLWTLRYEVLAYIGAAILFFSGIARGWRVHLALLIAATAGYLVIGAYWPGSPAIITLTLRLGAAFLLGMLIYSARNKIPLLPVVALFALPVWYFFGPSPLAETFLNLALASILFWLAFAKLGGLPTFSQMPDWSYGIYIWHYPVMQTLWYFDLARSPLGILLISVPVTFLVSALSWSLIEKPALSHKASVGNWLRRLVARDRQGL
ncbi:MAG: acyltransferase [Hyphobacterium sp.]|nr:MAG: acyltransferase [Hyphobacterium sp.]